MEWKDFDPHESRHRDAGRRAVRIIGFVVIGVFFAAIFALIFGFIVKGLWNWLMPGIFGLGVITYWQAFGMVILAKILFGGFGHNHHDRFQRKASRARDWAADGPGGRGGFDRSRYYGQYWREEGKSAFEAWLDRAEKKAAERSNESSGEKPNDGRFGSKEE